MADRVLTLAEQNAATVFLKALGVTPTANLMAAVVAWMNLESGGLSKIVGNNPFNLRPGVASKYSSGLRQIGTDPRTGEPQYVLKFDSLGKGLQAAAYYLKSLSQYASAITALKRGDVLGFLSTIGKLYSSKYGYVALYNEYKTYTLVAQPPVQQPGQPPQQPQPTVTWKYPRTYKTLRPLGRDDTHAYLDGYEVQRWYAARRADVEADMLS